MALLSEHIVSTNNGFITRQIDTPEGFRAMEGPWRELFIRSACPSVFSSWEWISEWCAHFIPTLCRHGTQASPVLLAVYDRNRLLVGITAFIEVRESCFLIGERRLIQIGLLYCDGAEPEEPVLLCQPGIEEEIIRAMRKHLTTRRLGGRWNHFTMLSCPPQGMISDNGHNRRHRPFWEQSHTKPASLTVALPQTWEDFRSSLSKSMRDNLTYYPRRLTRSGHSWAVRLLETPSEVEGAMPLLASLHKRRAESVRGRPHLDHLPTPTHTDFLTRCLPRLAARGLAFVAVLEVDGDPIAVQVFLQSAGVLTFYYSGFDLKWYDFSPITIIGEAIIRRAISQGMSKVNFLTDIHPWKTRWRAQPEGVFEFFVGFSPHPISLVYAMVRRCHRKRHI